MTALKVIIILGLLVVMLIIGLSTLSGNAGWLIIVGVALLAAGGVAYKWLRSKIKLSTYLCVLLLAVNVLVGVTLYIGAAPRLLLPQERRDILAYLELQYPGQSFKIVRGKALNSSLTGLKQLFKFRTFQWDEVEAIVADGNDVQFEVTGNDEWWNVRVGPYYFSDNYSLMQPQITIQDIHDIEDKVWGIIEAHHYLFDGGDFHEKNVEISFIPQHIEAYAAIRLNHMSKSDYDETAATEKMRIIRDAIAANTGFESVALNIRFYFSDE